MRALKLEWWRMVWHGATTTWRQFLSMPLVERYLDNEALNEMIDAGNARPEDTRR